MNPALRWLIGGWLALVAPTAWAQAPTVSALSPTRNLRHAPRSSSVAVSFSQPMQNTTATQQAVRVFSQQRGGLMFGSTRGVASVSGSTITFDPTTDFRAGETVFVTTTTAATATNASPLAAGHVHQFTAASAVANSVGNFTGTTTTATSSGGTYSAAAGDLDGDGDLDLVITNNNTTTGGLACVRFNDGTGGFSGSQNVAVGLQPLFVALGDLDGDGDLDFVTANRGADNSLSVRFNNGAGVFSGSTELVGDKPNGVELGDLDGDGDLDILSTGYVAPGTISVRFNNGNGTFGSAVVTSGIGSGFAHPSRLGDVDGDGDLDCVTPTGGNAVTVRLNNGSGAFSGSQSVTVGNQSQDLALGDVDGDGDLDFASANLGSGTANVSVRLNNNGTFSGGSDLTIGSFTSDAKFGDVDGDGDLDLVINQTTTPGVIHVRLNDGSGNFSGSASVSFAGGSRAFKVALADMDGDGDLDLIAPDGNGASVQVRLNQPPPPTVTGLAPTSGPVGTVVTITGTLFTGATAVTFNGTPATSFTVNSATQITATVPAGATTGVVSVTTPDGTGTSAGNFTVVLPPTITALSPTRNLRNAVRSANVAVTFSQAMQNTVGTQQAVRVFSQQRGGLMFGSTRGVASVSGSTITFNPATDFRPGETVLVTTTTAATSTGGATLAAGQVHQFTAAAGGTGVGNFQPPLTNATVTIPVFSKGPALGDVDGDGDLDLVAANREVSSQSVSVRLNDGTGVFSGSTTLAVPGLPENVVLGDFDGDGDLDLAACVYQPVGTSRVSVRLNDGSGNFSGSQNLSAGNQTIQVVLGDVDADGDLDLMTANRGSNAVSLFRNDGAGTFSSAANFSVGSGPEAMVLGDVDGDGDLDLMTANMFGNGKVSLRLNDGTGSFSGSTELTAGVNPQCLTLGDFDGDGDLDLAVAGYSSPCVVTTLLNDGAGNFGGGGSLTVGGNSKTMERADVDADGDLDLVVCADNTVVTCYNDGAAGFGVAITSATGVYTPLGMAMGDVDADGDIDVVATAWNHPVALTCLNQVASPTITALSPTRNLRNAARSANVAVTFSQTMQNTAGNQQAVRVFSQQRGGLMFGSTRGVASVSGSAITFNPTTDFRPGETVLVTTTAVATNTGGARLGRGQVHQFMAATGGTGRGNFVGGSDLNVSPTPFNLAPADVDGDGDLDAVISSQNSNTLNVLLNDGSGAFSPGASLSLGANRPSYVAVGDLDGDGDLDAVTANNPSNTACVALNGGSGTFSLTQTITSAFGANTAALGDLDGDGDLDLALSNRFGGSVLVRLNDGAGTFGGGATISLGTNPFSVAVGDVDGDGDLDFLTANIDAGSVSIRFNDGTGAFSGSQNVSVGADARRVALGDVDGDGDLDFAVTRFAGNVVVLGVNDGTGTFSAGAAVPMATGGAFGVALGDVDADGDLDLLGSNSNDGSVSLRFNDGTGAFSGTSRIPMNGMPNDLTLADIDADGDLDLLTGNTNSGNVSIRFNQPAPTITSITPGSGPVGTVVTLTGTNFTGAGSVAFNGTPAANFIVNSATQITATVGAGTTTGPVSVGSTTGNVFTVITDLVVSTPQNIAGGTYNSITVTGTGVGTLTAPTVVDGFVTVQSGGELRTACQTLTGAGSFTLAAGATLVICDPAGISASGATGAVQLNGPRTFSPDASYVYNGTGAQVTGSGLPATARNLTAAAPGGLTLTNPLAVSQLVTLSTAGNLISNGNLTLRSSAAGTAMVVQTSTGRVTGTATAERYLDPSANPGVGYRHFSAPTSNSAISDLDAPGFTAFVNPVYNTNPGSLTAANFPNVFGYDESRLPGNPDFLSGYFSPGALTDGLTAGRGYTVYMDGNVKTAFTGSFTSGPVALTLTRTGSGTGNSKTGWHLLGNPYPSPLDWDLIPSGDFPANMSQSVSVFRSTGAAAGGYLTRVNGLGTLTDGELAMAQGCFVKVTSGPSAVFTFQNAYRTQTLTNPSHFRPATDSRPLLGLTLRAATAGAPTTEALLYFQTGATPATDNAFDGPQPGYNQGNVPTLVSLAADGEELAVNGLPLTALATGTRVALRLVVPTMGAYTLGLSRLANLTGADLALFDALTGTTYPLTVGAPAYAFTAPTAGVLDGRFWLQIGSARVTGVASATAAPALAVWPNPVAVTAEARLTGAPAGAPVALTDALGRVVRTLRADATGATPLPLTGLPAGVYVVRAAGRTVRLVVE